jgi:hypothetical protein
MEINRNKNHDNYTLTFERIVLAEEKITFSKKSIKSSSLAYFFQFILPAILSVVGTVRTCVQKKSSSLG